MGCFCIGTDQVDLEAARERGIPVFNAPFSNTRSVAELVVAEIILLLRGIPARNTAAHRRESERAEVADFAGVPFRVVRADYLAVIALSVGRAKDYARVLSLLEAKATTSEAVRSLATAHDLLPAWERFVDRFLS